MTDSAQATRSDRRRERTRHRLVDAGRTLIAEKGVAGLRIQEITEQADVALGSFYNYFPTKEDLVEAVVADSLAGLGAATVVDDANQDPALTASNAVRRVVRLAFDDPEFARLVVNLSHAETLFAGAFHPFARQVVERGVELKRFETPDIEASVNLIVGGSLLLIRAILDGQHAEGIEVAHAEVALRALGVPGKEARTISQVKLPE
jgi:AcrR family transcriptional regulator